MFIKGYLKYNENKLIYDAIMNNKPKEEDNNYKFIHQLILKDCGRHHVAHENYYAPYDDEGFKITFTDKTIFYKNKKPCTKDDCEGQTCIIKISTYYYCGTPDKPGPIGCKLYASLVNVVSS